MTLYAPTDVDAAYESWGANCGPCALAAILEREVESVRAFMDSGWERRRYTNLMHMYAALRNAGVTALSNGVVFPVHGLAFIQWEGPWTAPGASVAWAYRQTHWIGVAALEQMVYDINADASWVPLDVWKKAMPVLMRESLKGCTGEWFVRKCLEVRPAAKGSPAAV